MTTDPCVIGTTQLQGHRNHPCHLFFLPMLACSLRPQRTALVAASRTMGALFGLMARGGARASRPRRKLRLYFADFAGIVTSCLLLFKYARPAPRRGFQMPTSAHRLPSRRSGAAQDRRPDRHDHAQPAGRLQLDRSFDRQKAGAARRGGRGVGRHQGAGDRRRRPRLLRRRRSADHRRCGRGGQYRARGRRIAQALSRLHRDHAADAEDRAVQRSRLGGRRRAWRLAFVADLCIAAEDARFTPAYAKIGVSPDGGSTVGMVGTVGTRRRLQIFLAEDSFSAQQAYDWGLVAKVVPAAELKAATRAIRRTAGAEPPAAIAGTKSLVYQAAHHADQAAARRRRREDHRRHAHR